MARIQASYINVLTKNPEAEQLVGGETVTDYKLHRQICDRIPVTSHFIITLFLSIDACTYHPGVPVFHDALKVWTCKKISLLIIGKYNRAIVTVSQS